jgi:anti-sigma factor RsiW
MNRELELELQAYVDGELSARQACRVENWVKESPEAQALLGELKLVSGLLRGQELERTLPETREFYWSKIQRAIEASARAQRPGSSFLGFGWFFRYWPQLSGAAVAALLLVVGFMHFGALAVPQEEIESPLDGTGSFTFRSEQERVTLVWVSNVRSDQDEEPESLN